MNGRFMGLLSGFCAVVLFLLFITGNRQGVISADNGTVKKETPVIVIDAGHGGEDGGASSADGLCEKDVNLRLCRMLQAYFTANGWHVIMTRTDDRLLYNRNVNFKGRKKVLDLAARYAIGEKSNPTLFLSVHMNAYPALPSCSGMQVWYSPNHPESARYAASLQASASKIQPDNHRKIKAAGSSIYLLHHLEIPAVLVEAGFLSNPAEAALLRKESYLSSLAFSIFCGVVETQASAAP